jgi:hypothetical protein
MILVAEVSKSDWTLAVGRSGCFASCVVVVDVVVVCDVVVVVVVVVVVASSRVASHRVVLLCCVRLSDDFGIQKNPYLFYIVVAFLIEPTYTCEVEQCTSTGSHKKCSPNTTSLNAHRTSTWSASRT